MAAETPSGQPVTCDGCGAPVEEVTEPMRHRVPDEIALRNYGTDNGSGELAYIVCAPMPDRSQPCLGLAQLAEEMYDRLRRRAPGCDGTRCGEAGRS